MIYDILYKNSIGTKPLRISFDKKDAFIKIHHKFRDLVLFDYGLCDKIFDQIKYLIREKEWYYRWY